MFRHLPENMVAPTISVAISKIVSIIETMTIKLWRRILSSISKEEVGHRAPREQKSGTIWG